VAAEDGLAAAWVIAAGVDLVLIALFLLFGVKARAGRSWAFVVGMALYALDALIALAFEDWMSLGFHGWALFSLWGGLGALRKLDAMGPEVVQPPLPVMAEPPAA
jgi:hypothetical protein